MKKDLSWVLFDRNIPASWWGDEEGDYLLPPIRVSIWTAFMLAFPLVFDHVEHLCNKSMRCGCVFRKSGEFLQREPNCSAHALVVPVPATPETIPTEVKPDTI